MINSFKPFTPPASSSINNRLPAPSSKSGAEKSDSFAAQLFGADRGGRSYQGTNGQSFEKTPSRPNDIQNAGVKESGVKDTAAKHSQKLDLKRKARVSPAQDQGLSTDSRSNVEVSQSAVQSRLQNQQQNHLKESSKIESDFGLSEGNVREPDRLDQNSDLNGREFVDGKANSSESIYRTGISGEEGSDVENTAEVSAQAAQASQAGQAIDASKEFGVSIGGATGSTVAANQATKLEAGNRANLENSPDDQSSKPTQTGKAHRRALENFMTSMQNEFGIPAEKIVDAFSKMEEKTLLAAPEESTSEFLAKLDLPAQKQARAGDLYRQMVRSTGEAALNEKILGADQGLQLNVFSPRDQALQDLNQAIDQLNDSFAMRPQVTNLAVTPGDQSLKFQMAAEQMSAQLRQLQQGQTSAPAGDRTIKKTSDEKMFASTVNEGEPSEFLTDASLGGFGILGAAAFGEATGATGTVSGAGGATQSAFVEESLANSMSNSMPDATSIQTSPTKQLMKDSQQSSISKTAGKSNLSSKNAEAIIGDGSSGQAAPLAAQEAAPVAAKPTALGPAGMMLERPFATAKDEKENVNELIRQAQLAVKKGGGEIKMDLKPEGMGQVHLKVRVDEGQVSVQMLTQNDEAKRLLERGLHELKSNLAAQQLKVENLKVDVGSEIQKHMDKNSDSQAREQMRQFAGDVMSQMRDQRQAFRQDFMENRGWRQYPRNVNREMMQPETNVAVTSSSRRDNVRGPGSNRLDLVA